MEENFGPSDRRVKKRLTSVETKFIGRTPGYTLFGHKRKEEILVELKVGLVDETLRR
jgi:hypothetical protein